MPPPAGDVPRAHPPHRDPRRWDELIASLKPAAMLTVIASAMSEQVRRHCSPEDIWQETLAMAWRDRGQHEWRDAASFRAWVFEIARNRIRSVARSLASQKRGAGRPDLPLADTTGGSSDSAIAPHPTDSVTPSRIVSRGEKQIAIEQALAEMPPDLREIVRLHLVEELTMEVIAQRLGLSVSAAWRRFRKGAAICERILPGRPRDGSSNTW
ncbi:MAG: RNA polymerase sigma factor [Planctomycetota bacterium]